MRKVININKPKIWANTLTYNEENFIWFAVMSFVDFVDKVMIWDTGSTDKTVEIIKEIKKIKGNKVDFQEVGKVDKFEFTKMRQKMLDKSRCDWILILDGDEVWWQESIRSLIEEINTNGKNLDAIIVPFYNLVGDIYHYQPEEVGEYQLLGRKGHLTVKAINRKIPGLHVENPYGKEGFFDGSGKAIQQRDPRRLIFVDSPFLHFTHLKRSSKRQKNDKFKYELGKFFPKDFVYPEVLKRDQPEIVPSPWGKVGKVYEIKSVLRFPLIYLWRKVKSL